MSPILRVSYSLAHVEDDLHVLRITDESHGINGDVVMKSGHHVGEVVDVVLLEQLVDQGQYRPHTRGHLGRRKTEYEGKHLLKEFCSERKQL